MSRRWLLFAVSPLLLLREDEMAATIDDDVGERDEVCRTTAELPVELDDEIILEAKKRRPATILGDVMMFVCLQISDIH